MTDALTYIQSVSVDHHRKKMNFFSKLKKRQKNPFSSGLQILQATFSLKNLLFLLLPCFNAELFYNTADCKHLYIFWKRAYFNQHKKKELRYCFLRNSFKTMCKIDRFLLPGPLLAQITIKSLKTNPRTLSFTGH